MLAKVFSAAVWGVDAYAVEVEVNAAPGKPLIVVVGLPDTAVKESRDRVITAITNSAFRFPWGRVTFNLAPADVKKEGPSFDLPMALGALVAADQIAMRHIEDYWIVGELALTGEVRPVKGALAIALSARKHKKKGLILPAANAAEAAVVAGLDVYPVKSLREAAEFLAGTTLIKPVVIDPNTILGEFDAIETDFADVKGQEHVKRAIEVAVAGGHNVLMIGPPGSGKSMLAKRIPGICPPLTLDEALETTKVHSVAGLLGPDLGLVTRRPFRSPHHTISDAGLIGGTANPSPGEVSLAHNGVLFLDELPEFRRSALEVLRQPLEDGTVTISRASGSMTFPAQFMLVAAMNPSPGSGGFGDAERGRASQSAIRKYLNKISGPLLDRIDIHVEVPAVKHETLLKPHAAESSAEIRARVLKARTIQHERFASKRKVRCNAQMSSKDIKTHVPLDTDSESLLRMALTELNLSARAYDRILKVSRTIADLAGAERVDSTHLSEAISTGRWIGRFGGERREDRTMASYFGWPGLLVARVAEARRSDRKRTGDALSTNRFLSFRCCGPTRATSSPGHPDCSPLTRMKISHEFPFDPTYGYTHETLLQVAPPPEPTGFADFWRATYREAMAIPLRIAHRPVRSLHRGFLTHEIEFDSWEGVRIGGWITLPEDGTFDFAVVMGHGYGGREMPDAWPRAVVISPCARGFHRSAHPRISGNAMEHVLLGIEHRDTYVHRGCVVDFWCAASALLELYPAAANRLYYRGGSFGGGIGAHVLAWDVRFHRGVLDVPSFGQYPLRVQLPCVGSGAAVRSYWRSHPEVLDVLAYFDAACAARHVTVPTLVSPALFDPAVPPPGQFAVANALPEPKELFVKSFGHFIDRIEVREARELEQRVASYYLE